MKERELKMRFKTSEEKRQFIYTYLAFMLNGILALSIGSLLPFIRESKGLNYAFAGLLVSLHSVGNLISSFASGTLSVFIGRKRSILLFNACYALAYVLIIFSSNNYMLALAYLMSGLARGHPVTLAIIRSIIWRQVRLEH